MPHLSLRISARIWAMCRRTLLGIFVAQVITIASLMTWDALRKRSNKKQIDLRLLATDATTVSIGSSDATPFTYGEDLYEDMLASIDRAQRQVLIESYIWKDDAYGKRFKRAIIDAADRGVDVHVIYDSFANLVVSPRFKRFPPSVKVLAFPLFSGRIPLLNIRNSGRDHRKILVVDGKVGYVGGYNIGSLYATDWRDTHLKLTGSAVWDLENAFIDFWNVHRKSSNPLHPKLQDHGSPEWDSHIRVHRNSPKQLVYPIRGMYLEAFDRAQSHIYITQAYFIPDRDLLRGLVEASRRGVDVRIIVPKLSNHVVADWLARGFYSTLLANGIKVLLYKDAMVHAKTATVDGKWSTIGTANIDRLSLSGNYEINVEMFDEGMAKQLEIVFDKDSDNTSELTAQQWAERKWIAKFSEAILAPLRPLL
ncbi:MAG: phospholipase D/Transphosphatidylase [Nocardioidaceae bacterium]|nr:phospholipase D/Transphosphatidylase [Nocardioidaceae bacterium]